MLYSSCEMGKSFKRFGKIRLMNYRGIQSSFMYAERLCQTVFFYLMILNEF